MLELPKGWRTTKSPLDQFEELFVTSGSPRGAKCTNGRVEEMIGPVDQWVDVFGPKEQCRS